MPESGALRLEVTRVGANDKRHIIAPLLSRCFIASTHFDWHDTVEVAMHQPLAGTQG